MSIWSSGKKLPCRRGVVGELKSEGAQAQAIKKAKADLPKSPEAGESHYAANTDQVGQTQRPKVQKVKVRLQVELNM